MCVMDMCVCDSVHAEYWQCKRRGFPVYYSELIAGGWMMSLFIDIHFQYSSEIVAMDPIPTCVIVCGCNTLVVRFTLGNSKELCS